MKIDINLSIFKYFQHIPPPRSLSSNPLQLTIHIPFTLQRLNITFLFKYKSIYLFHLLNANFILKISSFFN